MAATQADVRRALLDAHPYNTDDVREVVMGATNGDMDKAAKMLRLAAKSAGPGHFGIKDRAERVIARLDKATEEPKEEDEDAEHAALMAETQALVDAGTQSIQEGKGVLVVAEGQDEDPGPDDEDAEGIDPFADDELAGAFEQALDKGGDDAGDDGLAERIEKQRADSRNMLGLS